VRVRRATFDVEKLGAAAPCATAPRAEGAAPVVARVEATRLGLDIRYIVTSLARARAFYEKRLLRARQAEDYIKLHKAQLASDRTSWPRSAPQPGAVDLARMRLIGCSTCSRRSAEALAAPRAEFTTLRAR